MFAMRYCRKCLEKFKFEAEGLAPTEALLLNIPVEDQFGVVLRAHMRMLAGEFIDLLETGPDIVDLSQHAVLMGIEVPESPAYAHVYH